MRIFLLDDAAALRFLLARIVRELGHDVAGEAADLADAAARLPALRPDAIAIDGRIAPGEPATVVAALRAAAGDAALCFITALDESGLARAGREAGASHAILRPYLRSQVHAVLQAIQIERAAQRR